MEESYPPDEPITRFSITASTDNNGQSWFVTCPEWNYKNETNEPLNLHIGLIVREIMKHNEHTN